MTFVLLIFGQFGPAVALSVFGMCLTPSYLENKRKYYTTQNNTSSFDTIFTHYLQKAPINAEFIFMWEVQSGYH